MIRRHRIFIALIALFTLLMIFTPKVFANIEDGTYKLPYEIKHENEAVMAIVNDHFVKPAVLKIENGKKHIQIMLTEASKIKSLQSSAGPVEIVQELEEEDIQVIRLVIEGELTGLIFLEMYIDSPELKDQSYRAQAVFDLSSLNIKPEEELNKEDENEAEEGNDEENNFTPQASEQGKKSSGDSLKQESHKGNIASAVREDHSLLWIPITLLGLLLMVLISYFIYRNQ